MTIICVDCLIGPTYHFGGLSYGNTHSMSSKLTQSNPKKAALEGLEKMYSVMSAGVDQFVLPPYTKEFDKFIKPYVKTKGGDPFNELFKNNKPLFSAMFSSSAAWIANGWTATSPCDNKDKRCHISIANLEATRHRKLDVQVTITYTKELFGNRNAFEIHQPLSSKYLDEGAANMIRLGDDQKGLYLFVYGDSKRDHQPKKFPYRQTKDSWEELIENHGLIDNRYCLIQQSPEAIDSGVFHNDVIAFGLENMMVVHEKAFVNQSQVLDEIKQRYNSLCDKPLQIIEIHETILSLDKAIKNYFFNSQLIKNKNGEIYLFCPRQCESDPAVKQILKQFKQRIEDSVSVVFVDVNESIKNGGGPACLRNMLQLSSNHIAAIPKHFKLNQHLYHELKSFIITHYPTTFQYSDGLSLDKRKKYETIINQLNEMIRRKKYY